MKGIIYKYTNQVNGKVYIGQTINEYKRKYSHSKALNSWRSYFHEAVKKYGIDSFSYEVLKTIDRDNSQDLKIELDKEEQRYIAEYKSNNKLYGYNLTIGGSGTLGIKQSEESNAKRSKSMKAKKKTLTTEQVEYLQSFNKHDYLAHHTPVEKYSLDGEFLARFGTLKEAAKSVDGNLHSLSRAIRRERLKGVFKGYYWKLV